MTTPELAEIDDDIARAERCLTLAREGAFLDLAAVIDHDLGQARRVRAVVLKALSERDRR
jgi:hypothetical protein